MGQHALADDRRAEDVRRFEVLDLERRARRARPAEGTLPEPEASGSQRGHEVFRHPVLGTDLEDPFRVVVLVDDACVGTGQARGVRDDRGQALREVGQAVSSTLDLAEGL